MPSSIAFERADTASGIGGVDYGQTGIPRDFSGTGSAAPQSSLTGPDGNGGGGADDLGLDPLLIALLRKIPSTEKGWPAFQRVRWFRTFAMNVSQIYDTEGEPVEMEIKVADTKE